jgi:hypothetical protein
VNDSTGLEHARSDLACNLGYRVVASGDNNQVGSRDVVTYQDCPSCSQARRGSLGGRHAPRHHGDDLMSGSVGRHSEGPAGSTRADNDDTHENLSASVHGRYRYRMKS